MPHIGIKMEGGGSGGKMPRRSEPEGYGDDKNSDSYRQKRDRNNLAVKKSREKMRQKCSETTQRMATLRAENEELQQKVNGLSTELSIMKELLLAHARGNRSPSSSTPTTTASDSQATTSLGGGVTVSSAAVTKPSVSGKKKIPISAAASTGRKVISQPTTVLQIPTSMTTMPVSSVVNPSITQIPTSAIMSSHGGLIDNKAAIFISPAVTAPGSTILVQAQHDHGYFVQPNQQIMTSLVSMNGTETKPFVSNGNVLNVVPIVIQSQPQVYSLITSSAMKLEH